MSNVLGCNLLSQNLQTLHLQTNVLEKCKRIQEIAFPAFNAVFGESAKAGVYLQKVDFTAQ